MMGKSMKRITVTGICGFIGRHVVEVLLSKVQTVTGLDFDAARARSYDWFPKIDFIHWDLKKRLENPFAACGQPDALIHLAWEGLPNYKELFHIENNLFHHYFFIRDILEKGLKNLSVTGTCLEYGLQNGCLKEEFDTRP